MGGRPERKGGHVTIHDRIGSYIVRMYGDAAAGDEAFVGIAQDVEGGGQYPFKGPDDLWAILTADCPDPQTRANEDAARMSKTRLDSDE